VTEEHLSEFSRGIQPVEVRRGRGIRRAGLAGSPSLLLPATDLLQAALLFGSRVEPRVGVIPIRSRAPGLQRLLEAAMKSLNQTIRLWMVCSRLCVADVQDFAKRGPQVGGELRPSV
jgi:hypothetical protein